MRRVMTAAAVVTVLAGGMLATASGASAHPRHDRDDGTIAVHGTGAAVTLSRSHVAEGTVRFRVDTTGANGSEITMFRPNRGVSLATVAAEFAEEFGSDPAKGTRDLTRDVRFYGLADVVTGTPATVTEQLCAGTYYLMDIGTEPGPSGPAISTLTVTRHRHGRPHAVAAHRDRRHHEAVVRLTSSDRFVSPHRLPAHGTITVANVSDTLHFMDIQPVARGTTDAQIQAYFDSGSQAPPPFMVDGPSVGIDVLSPGHHAQLGYRLPRGTYVLLCFVADDTTGMPHALMGMHKVVVLR